MRGRAVRVSSPLLRIIEAVWEPIIDAESFERAGELLVENRARAGNVIGPKHYDYYRTRNTAAAR